MFKISFVFLKKTQTEERKECKSKLFQFLMDKNELELRT